jgi:hypothetical protein
MHKFCPKSEQQIRKGGSMKKEKTEILKKIKLKKINQKEIALRIEDFVRADEFLKSNGLQRYKGA